MFGNSELYHGISLTKPGYPSEYLLQVDLSLHAILFLRF